ncbi:hypothetical protein AC578_6557 [Pseudocercospora eumusae]|uniref:Uncharacterized protein n=1 Tax=Pseudocercospora eumusae TaxID=321146 RepID=A0A139HHM7_9PEZI|nr:hypothetical protein AC578_6557 [Pseudocercospora eumusae]
MPAAGRGAPLSKTTNYNWTDDEYATLHIIQVEHPYLDGPDVERLWHQRFTEHMKQGREYNASKLKETWQYRHYKGKSLKWKTIARPNRRPEGEDQTQYSAQEQAHIQGLRRELQNAANTCTPPINLQAPANRVDSGTMCDCNACQGTVRTRSALDAETEAAKDKKGKARGISAKKDSVPSVNKKIAKRPAATKRPAKRDDDTSNALATAEGGTQRRSRREMKRPVYADPDNDSYENDAEEFEEEIMHGNDSDDDMDLDNEGEDDSLLPQSTRTQNTTPAPFMPALSTSERSSFHSSANAFSTSAGQAPQGSGTSRTGIAASDTGQRQSTSNPQRGRDAGKSAEEGQGSEMDVDEPIIHLATVEVARGSLRMVHHRDLLVYDNKLRLRDGFTLVKKDTPVYQHGGQVMMIAPSTQQAGPFMVCDTNKCTACKRKADKNMESPTEGRPFVHLGECIRDLSSGHLLFAPTERCEYAPASSDQPLYPDNAVLICPGLGPRLYDVVNLKQALLEGDNGVLSRAVVPILLSPVAGSLAAAALASAPANVQGAVNGSISATSSTSNVPTLSSGPAMSAPPYFPMANVPATKTIASAGNAVTRPSGSASKNEGASAVDEGERPLQGEAQHDLDQEDNGQSETDGAQNLRVASITGGKSFQDWCEDMLEDDDVDDDESIFEITPSGRIALQAHQDLPMVHQDHLIFGPRSSRDKQYITTIPASIPRIEENDTVYKYGGTAVRTISELTGRITDVMVCSKDICKNERCYTPPGKEDPLKPEHTPMPFKGLPFVHTKRDCIVRDGVTYFEGVLDIPNSSWSSLPPQVQDMDVMFVVDGGEAKVRVQGCVVSECPICQRVVAHERLVANGEEEEGRGKKLKGKGRRNAGRVAKGKA